MNVGSGQLGMHLLHDWNGNLNVDMALVLETNAIFGSGIRPLSQTLLTAERVSLIFLWADP